MLKFAFAAFAALAAAPVFAEGLCVDASVPRAAIAEKNGHWVEVAPQQYHFLPGIYAMNPRTPPGLPWGDRAILASIPDHDGALVFFIDGTLACTPIPVPKELVEMLGDVATGKNSHQGVSH